MCCPELETLHNAVMKTICSDVKRQEKRIWMEMKEEKTSSESTESIQMDRQQHLAAAFSSSSSGRSVVR